MKLECNQLKKYFVVTFLMLIFSGCSGSNVKDPLPDLKSQLTNEPTYSIILEDMDVKGLFSKDYLHKYRVVTDSSSNVTDWMNVSEKNFKANEELVGMALFSMKDGESVEGASPPGYAYVGDERYGKWKDDGKGSSFWEFYGKYALFSSLFGGWYNPVYRGDYNSYQNYRGSNRTFFGSKKQYGSSGSIVKKTKPDFYARKSSNFKAGKSSFGSKVSSRTGRTKTSFRARSGGSGK